MVLDVKYLLPGWFGNKGFHGRIIGPVSTRPRADLLCPAGDYAKQSGDMDPLDLKSMFLFNRRIDEYEKVANGIMNAITMNTRTLFISMYNGTKFLADHGDKNSLEALSVLPGSSLFELPGELMAQAMDFAVARERDIAGDETPDGMELGPREKAFAESIGLPSPLPFSKMTMLVKPPVPVSAAQSQDEPANYVADVGWTIADGVVFCHSLDLLNGKDGLPAGISFESQTSYRDGEWSSVSDAILIHLLVQWINDHRQYIEQRGGCRVSSPSTRGRRVHQRPVPYYTVLMRDDLIVKTLDVTSRKMMTRVIDWQHRWGVRGHEVVKFHRGHLPISFEDRSKYRDLGYRVYEDVDPPDDDYKRMVERGLEPKGDDEWVAIKSFWRNEHIKGPEDKPFVPALRKSARKREHAIRFIVRRGGRAVVTVVPVRARETP